jgi:hypothetical protein
MDTTPPTVISSVRAGTNPTNAASVNFTVTFSESVTGVDVSDFNLTITGVSGAAVSSVSGSGATRTVTVNTGSGNGTIRLNVIDNDSIMDGASNRLGGTGAGNGNYSAGQVYTIDKTAPTVTSSLRANPNPTNAASVNFTVTFSESVTGVDVSDFGLTVTGGVAGATVTSVSGSGSTYTVNVNTGTGDGTLRLRLIDNDTIVDSAGNKLGGTGIGNGNFNTGQTYTINKTLTYNSVGTNDGWVLESTETSNVGGTGNNVATNFALGDDAANKQYRGLLHFDTSSLPDTAIITSVTVRIKRQGLSGTDPFTTHGNLLVDIRKPYFGTSAALALGDFQAVAGQSAVGTFGVAPVSNWYSAILSNAGYPQVNLTGTTQYRLRFTLDDNNDSGADFMVFYSGDAAAANRPQLIITYYVP